MKFVRKHFKHILLFKFILLAILICLFYFLIITNPKQAIFPLNPLNQSSLFSYIDKHKGALSTILPLPELVEHGSRNKKEIALTFDADMTLGMQQMLKNGTVKSWYNKPIKDYLDKEQVKSTMFLTGLWVQAYPEVVKEMAKDPLIEIGNHSYSHPAFSTYCFDLPFIADTHDEDEINNAQQAIIKTTGIVPVVFRFPGGCNEKIDLETISRLGLAIIQWDVVGGDALNQNPTSIVQNIKNQTKNGSIIVLHISDGLYAPKTYEALLEVIPYLKKQGFEFVTVSELLKNRD